MCMGSVPVLWRVVYACAAMAAVAAVTPATVDTTVQKDGPVTVTPAGTIRGSWMSTRRGRRFQAYRGVRYAHPPTGELRFQPPKPILQYDGEVDASQEGPACPLPAPPSYYVDEDCLRLNVYTPTNKRSAKLPVIVFIHPGGFYSMTGRSDLAGPHYLLEKDLVLVTLNYRLSALGFISTGDEVAPGNNGMKDQVMALRWVQRNIAAFGGDPGRVTVAGVSAGAISATLHMISPMTKGLFHRAISISGSATGKEPTPPHQRHLAEKQARLLGCPTNSSRAIIDCLKTKPWKELGDSYPKFFEIGYDPVGLWGPVVEPAAGQERYLDMDASLAVCSGRMHAVPQIISVTTDEFSWFARNILKNETLLKRMNAEWKQLAPISFMLPRENSSHAVEELTSHYLHDRPLANDEASAKGMGNLYVDSIMGFPIRRMLNLMAQYSPEPVYFYEFAYIGNHSHWEDPDTKKPVGAMHHDDMLYLFTLPYRFPTIELGTKDDEMVSRMTAIWYNFAKYGEPTPRQSELGDLSWPAVTSRERRYLHIDSEMELRTLQEYRYAIWERLYPDQSCPAH
ncbi:esterase E4-like [Pectinophora gossypiella]|uniref:esterase E4-like n=1 Tax=Pectinophora gossypiella TaxID=13191 RepID=UPI00214E7744|nr:esterase E4-like [Pectinophora gossypiella]